MKNDPHAHDKEMQVTRCSPEPTPGFPSQTQAVYLSPHLPVAQQFLAVFSRASLHNYEEIFGTSYVLLLHTLICLPFALHYVGRFVFTNAAAVSTA